MGEKIVQSETKTPYEWCLESNIRVLDINEWPLKMNGSTEKHYYEYSHIGKVEFLEALKQCRIKNNSTPRKTEKYLEWRMYGLVPYNISEIQKGIQYGHAVVEYMLNVKGVPGIEAAFNKWAKNDKTFIILNGGTTNENKNNKWYGTLQQHRDTIRDLGVPIAEFKEPDLNETLTSFVFLVDERVWNKDLYPDFVEEKVSWDKRNNKKEIARVEANNIENYIKWVEKIGNEKNAFLRTYLKQFKLA